MRAGDETETPDRMLAPSLTVMPAPLLKVAPCATEPDVSFTLAEPPVIEPLKCTPPVSTKFTAGTEEYEAATRPPTALAPSLRADVKITVADDEPETEPAHTPLSPLTTAVTVPAAGGLREPMKPPPVERYTTAPEAAVIEPVRGPTKSSQPGQGRPSTWRAEAKIPENGEKVADKSVNRAPAPAVMAPVHMPLLRLIVVGTEPTETEADTTGPSTSSADAPPCIS